MHFLTSIVLSVLLSSSISSAERESISDLKADDPFVSADSESASAREILNHGHGHGHGHGHDHNHGHHGHWRSGVVEDAVKYKKVSSDSDVVEVSSDGLGSVSVSKGYGHGHHGGNHGHGRYPIQSFVSTTVLLPCHSDSAKGLCVNSEELCERQGGEFYGFCFRKGNYHGVCCLGLNPANATLPGSTNIDSILEDPTPTSATISPPTLPPVSAPSFPTYSPPAMPNMTTPAMPTFTPPAMPSYTPPSYTPPAVPNVTAPTWPAYTNPTMPTMTPPAVPTAPTLPAYTPPPMTPPAVPTMSVPTLPAYSTPSVPTLTPPPMPSMTPPAMPSVTPPAVPSYVPPTLPPVPVPSVPTLPPVSPPPASTTAPAADFPAPPSAPEGVGPEVVADPNCSTVTTLVESYFSNPSYPTLDTVPKVYQYVVHPAKGYCGLRIEFLEAMLAGKSGDSCSVDSVQILGSPDGPTAPQCGLLQGYQYTVHTIPEQPVRIVITAQSPAYVWNIRVKQIDCKKIPSLQDYKRDVCGIKNSHGPAGVVVPEAEKVIPAQRLLKSSRRKTFAEITLKSSSAPIKLLEAAVEKLQNVKIVRGNETGINEYPWQVLLLVNGIPICGGSIISEQYILTAGHCVNLNLRLPLVSLMTVDVGDHDLRSVKETRNAVVRVSRIIPNAQYEQSHNDIAILKLAGKLKLGKTVRPVCLPNQKDPVDTYEGRDATATGWGRTEDSVISPVLREATVKVVSNDDCRAAWNTLAEGGGSLIEDSNICAGTTDAGVCNGDSGGPLVTYDEGKWRLIGLTSFGSLKGCGLPEVPPVFTRISSHLDWIALNTAE